MSALTALLTEFPNCRVTIGSPRPRHKPRPGDRRFIKSRGGWHIRRQQVARSANGKIIGYCVRDGRPRYEWVREASLPLRELAGLMREREWTGGKDLT